MPENTICSNNAEIGVSCAICGNTVKLTEQEKQYLEYFGTISTRFCEECKEAIIWARDQMYQSMMNGS